MWPPAISLVFASRAYPVVWRSDGTRSLAAVLPDVVVCVLAGAIATQLEPLVFVTGVVWY